MPKGQGGFKKSKSAPFNKETRGWLAANKHLLKTFVHGNAKHFELVTIPLMGMKASDFPHFKGTDSKTVSGVLVFVTPNYIVASKNLFKGWKHDNLADGSTRIDSIDLVIRLAKQFGIKPTYPIDLDAAYASENLSINFGD